MTRSKLEELFLRLWNELPLGRRCLPVMEYRFSAHAVGGPGRGVKARLAAAGLKDWRFDFAWPECKVAVEVEGGTWSRGRHVRGGGFRDDCEKYNCAAALGWRVFRFTAEMLEEEADRWLSIVGRFVYGYK